MTRGSFAWRIGKDGFALKMSRSALLAGRMYSVLPMLLKKMGQVGTGISPVEST